MILKSLVALLSVTLCINAAAQLVQAEPDLKALCSGGIQSWTGANDLQVQSSADLLKLLEQGSDEQLYQEANCAERVRAALTDLYLLTSEQNDNVCSAEKLQEIRKFSENYLESSEANKSKVGVPKALRNFYIAYGLRVSAACKKNMIGALQYESQQLLNDNDFQAINKWTDENSVINGIMSEPSDYDDLLLPRDITRALLDADEAGEGSKIVMQTMTGHLIARLQLVCERRFKPLYERLILPVISLSNLGFNYQGEDLLRERDEMNNNKAIHQWYRIVYICESLNSIEIVEDPEFVDQAEAGAGTDGELMNDKRVVRVLSREEADALKAKAKLSGQQVSVVSKEELDEFKQIVYEPEQGVPLQINDEQQQQGKLFSVQDKSFVKLINQFDTRKSELERIRDKLFKKVGAILLQSLKRGQFKIIGSLFKRSSSNQGNTDSMDSPTINDELVRSLDSYIHEQKNGLSPDDEVAGLGNKMGGVAKRYYNTVQYKGVTGITGQVISKARDKVSLKRKFWYGFVLIMFICAIALLAMAG